MTVPGKENTFGTGRKNILKVYTFILNDKDRFNIGSFQGLDHVA